MCWWLTFRNSAKRAGDARRRALRGFTLIELLVSTTIGLIVVGAATYLFSKALSANWTVNQRAEMQQNERAALGLLSSDITLAGAGMPTGGVQLPTGTAFSAKLGCDQTQCYVGGTPPAGIAYPNNHLYGVIPGYRMGIASSAGGAATDTLTVVYTDTSFALNLYRVTAFGPRGTSVTVAAPNPQPNPPVPQINDPAVGLQVGDLVLLSNTAGSAIGEVTGLVGTTIINFADLDALLINQSAAPSGNIKAIAGGLNTTATRIWVITYYLDVPPGPDGVRYTDDDLPPRLMRQVSGRTPTPVADGVASLLFSYDIYDDSSATATAGLNDGGLALGKSPNQIRKVNIVSLATRSAMHGARGYQGLDLSTSVSVRDMSFRDRYQ
jgi:prepilin-type N-terminal cleavage/methylation domain-containing protein